MTFFSYSKTKHHPCPQDCGFSFSPLFSIINIIISTICFIGVLARHYLRFLSTDLFICLVPYLLGIVFSLLVIFYEKMFGCCCGWCLGAEERMVYDPDHPEAELVWRDGQVQLEILCCIWCIFILFPRLLNWKRVRMRLRRLRSND